MTTSLFGTKVFLFMNEPTPNRDVSAQSKQGEGTGANQKAIHLPSEPQDKQDPPANSQKLSPEEQMALYEKALKEDDWGHQPC